MTRRIGFLFLTLGCAIIPLVFLFSHSLSAQTTASPGKIDPELWAVLQTAVSDEDFRVLLDVYGRTDLTNQLATTSLEARRFGTVAQLQQTAVSSQAALLQNIETLTANGQISDYHPFWVVNKIAVTGSKEAILALTNHHDIQAIRLDAQIASILPPDDDEILSLLQATVVASTTGKTWGIERIRAPYAWHGLGIDGNGVTVAIMDSGVDFTHPDLIANYRGNLGSGSFNHADNWLHTTIPTATVPTDTLGHGTHVAGTAVGQNGIGVAPGANWIAVSITDQFGFIYESDVHEGFEWILAPNGNPALAPDVVNNSWSGPGFLTSFYQDVLALHAAGIIPAFAAGNDGPFPDTIGAPASYTDTLAIGASDDTDGVAWFSSLGPSPLTDEIKPWVLAPGTQTYSSLPGGGYGYSNGTSMATPHAAGTMALVLSANPALSRHEVLDVLANTAVPISTTRPNMVHGWGRIDAYTAVASQLSPGKLSGIVSANGVPQNNITITLTTPSGGNLAFVTDANGRYTANLNNGSYNLAVDAFGFAPFAHSSIAVQNNQTTTYDINLTRLPSGTVRGTVRSAATNTPLPHTTIYVPGIPVTTTTDANGRYSLILPANSYKLHARASQHFIKHHNILLPANQSVEQNFTLSPTRAILLVDSGKWYFQSQAATYQNALASLQYPVDTWTISHPFLDRPTLADLAPYDEVIWSSPLDSPGYIGAGEVVSDYLGLGKNMLISGQNVGFYDGFGFDTQWWWYALLDANYLGSNTVTQTMFGAPGTTYENIVFTLNGENSAQNQSSVDLAEPRRGTLSQPNFYLADGYPTGLQAGHCEPFRLSYTGFGLEGVSDAIDRAAILQQSFAYFDSPRTYFGAQFTPKAVDDFAVPGETLAYTLTVRNMSESLTDTLHLSTLAASWQTSLLTQTLTLGPCELGETVLSIQVPDNAAKDYEHVTQITAVSSNNPTTKEYLLLDHKIPGQILFVDDDRWYDYEDRLTTTLDQIGLAYDVWETGYNQRGRGSPAADFLNEYEYIIWYTGYDWFEPLTVPEREALTGYLAQGGRLFLTSQDFLWPHHNSELARAYFGVQSFWEYWGQVVPTAVFGAAHPALDNTLDDSLPLDFSIYQNHMDAVIPYDMEDAFFWSDRGYPAGTATAGNQWRAAFLAYPLELMEETSRQRSMNHILGWLTDFGESTFAVDEEVALAGEPRTFTITLHNAAAGVDNNLVVMTNTLPTELTFNPATITGGAAYNATSRQLTWQGELDRNETHLITYQATPDANLEWNDHVTNTVVIDAVRHGIQFEKATRLWFDVSDLQYSVVTAVPNQPFAGDTLTYTFRIHNSGPNRTNVVTATMPFFDYHVAITDTLSTSGGTASLGDHRVYWEGVLLPQATVTVTVAVIREVDPEPAWIPTTAVVDDGLTRTVLRGGLLEIRPYQQYFPIIFQNK